MCCKYIKTRVDRCKTPRVFQLPYKDYSQYYKILHIKLLKSASCRLQPTLQLPRTQFISAVVQVHCKTVRHSSPSPIIYPPSHKEFMDGMPAHQRPRNHTKSHGTCNLQTPIHLITFLDRNRKPENLGENREIMQTLHRRSRQELSFQACTCQNTVLPTEPPTKTITL